MDGFLTMAAPLQGHTDAHWRAAHASVMAPHSGAAHCYFTPFARVEHGEVRRRDLRDAAAALTGGAVPQILFRDLREWDMLTEALVEQGHRRIDLNLGCPFPPQVKHGRGAALLRQPELLLAVAERMSAMHDVKFSVKMRLGVERADEWLQVAAVIAAMPLTHVAVHSRTAREQYAGELHVDAIPAIAASIPHPIVINGDISSPELLAEAAAMPGVAGAMIGRALHCRPSLIAEWREGREWSHEERIATLLAIHAQVLSARRELLCGDSQLLAAMRTFWEYAEPEIGHKAAKALRKASSMAKYNAAVAAIE